MSRKETAAAAAGVAAWYLLVFLAARPLADGAVVDGWIYAHAVGVFRTSGSFRFAGYTQAMPIAQVVYGALWSGLFGASPASFDLSGAFLGALGALLFYALLRRCGARSADSALATGLLAANPCYLFLSFSFMTEIPFLALVIAAYYAFARAEGTGELLWLWLSAALATGAFLVRPFAGAAIAGFAGALLICDLRPARLAGEWLRRAVPRLLPFAAALGLCALAWIWLTVLNREPWSLRRDTQHIEYLLLVPATKYLRAGVVAPLLYLGVVLSPLALVKIGRQRWRHAAAIGAAIFAVTWILLRLDRSEPATPELSCFGGWSNALLLQGLPTRFRWGGGGQWLAAALGAAGAAGLIVTAREALAGLKRGAAAVLLSAACYWAVTIPLWMFNDRYYLVLVPAAALLLALGPRPASRRWVAAGAVMTAVLGYVSIAGVYDYQRGLAAVIAARDALKSAGVPRAAIDAGYSLNGADLYRYSDGSEDTPKLEQGIPMITSAALDEYTIAAAPIAGTQIVRRFTWPGPFGFGSRELFVVRRIRAAPANGAGARATAKRF